MLKKCFGLFAVILTLSLLRPATAAAAYPVGFEVAYTGAVRPLREWTEGWRYCGVRDNYRVSTVWTGSYDWYACEGTGTHGGVDIPAPEGTDVRSFGAGTIDWVYVNDPVWGNSITIRHVDMPNAWGGGGVTIGATPTSVNLCTAAMGGTWET